MFPVHSGLLSAFHFFSICNIQSSRHIFSIYTSVFLFLYHFSYIIIISIHFCKRNITVQCCCFIDKLIKPFVYIFFKHFNLFRTRNHFYSNLVVLKSFSTETIRLWSCSLSIFLPILNIIFILFFVIEIIVFVILDPRPAGPRALLEAGGRNRGGAGVTADHGPPEPLAKGCRGEW